MRALLCCFLVVWPGLGIAQDWATPEVCTVSEARIDDAVLSPPGRDALEATAASIENGVGRFWQVVSPEGGVSHLWGTYHSTNPLVLDLPAPLTEAIAQARIVAVEIDWVLKSREVLGRVAGAEIVGLEQPFQMADDLNAEGGDPISDAIIAVYGAYLKPQTNNAERSTSIAMYLEGRLGLMAVWDAVYLERVLGDRAEEALRLTDGYLLDTRNERFLERIGPELAEGGVVVAVGAAHLPGENGLVSMLRRSGFEVVRKPVAGEVE